MFERELIARDLSDKELMRKILKPRKKFKKYKEVVETDPAKIECYEQVAKENPIIDIEDMDNPKYVYYDPKIGFKVRPL